MQHFKQFYVMQAPLTRSRFAFCWFDLHGILHLPKNTKKKYSLYYYFPWWGGEGGGKGTPGNSWWGCAAQFSKSCPFLRPKNVIFHTHFQTKPRKSKPVFRPGLQAEIMSSSVRLECKQKTSSNAFEVRIPYIFYFFLIYLELKP